MEARVEHLREERLVLPLLALLPELASGAGAGGMADAPMAHARTEETMLYPAAIVAGEYAGLLSR